MENLDDNAKNIDSKLDELLNKSTNELRPNIISVDDNKTPKKKPKNKEDEIIMPKIYIKTIGEEDFTDFGKNDPFSELFLSLLGKPLMKPENISKEKIPLVEPFKIDETIDYEEIDVNKTLNDLIKLGESYSIETKNKYAFDFEKLHNIVPCLKLLQETIGMETIKKNIINQIVYFLLNLEIKHGMMNTAIYGPPGIGKTLVGRIIGEIYNKLGLIANSDPKKDVKLKTYKASMLIGEYLGHTRKRTKDAINECLKSGSVMFLDEAYALSSGSKNDKNDSYAFEAIDEINIALSENPNFILIIAGYEDDLEKRFFAINKGLDRRFPFRYKIDKYDHVELSKIFLKKIKDDDWKFEEQNDRLVDFFKTNIKAFPAYGGSVDELFFNVKINHGLRIFGKKPDKRKLLTMDDVNEGFQHYKKVKNIKEDENMHIFSMYS